MTTQPHSNGTLLDNSGKYDSPYDVNTNVTSDETRSLLHAGPGSFEASLPPAPVQRDAIDPRVVLSHEEIKSPSLLSPRRTRSRSRRFFDSMGSSAKGFLEKQTWVLSTQSTIETTDPYDVVKCSNLQTLMNLMKGTTGTGILTLPYAFMNGGLWVGTVSFLIVALVSVHCMHIASSCAEIIEERTRIHVRNYPDVVEYTFKFGPTKLQRFANKARIIVNGLIYVMHGGICCIYIVWIATNVKPVIDVYWSDSPDVRVYEVVVFVCLLPYIMVKSLRTLAFFSAIANLFYVVGMTIIFQYILQDIPNANDRPAFNSFSTFPMFLGTAVFSYESVCLVIPLRNKIEKVEDFGGWTGVLTLGMVIISAVYCATGFYGYLKFGDAIASAITLNLPQDQWLYLSVNLIFAVVMYISVAVQMYVPINVLWPAIEDRINVRYRKVAECFTRATLLLIIMLFGIVVPHIELLMSLVGSFCGCSLAIIIPAVLDLINMHEERRLTPFVLCKDGLIILIGVIGFATGSYAAIVDIVNTF